MRTALAFGIVLVAIGYLVIQFGTLVLGDLAADRATGEDAAHDAETARWIAGLREPVEVKPADASSLDALVGGLLAQQLVPVQRQPGESS